MSDGKVVSLRGAICVEGKPHQPTVDRLARWLASAEKGEIVGVGIVAVWSSHHVTTDMVYPDGYGHDLHSGAVVMSHRMCAHLLDDAEVGDQGSDE
jgi:hypothetical protein